MQLRKYWKNWRWMASLCLLYVATLQAAAPQSSSSDTIVNLPVAAAWELFTTPAGLKSLGYAAADIELRLNGKIQTAGGRLPPLAAEIVSFEPQRMLSLRHDAASWAVLYFQPLGDDMTGIRWVEFAAAERAQNLAALEQAHRELFNDLVRRYAPQCALCKNEAAAAQ